MFFAVLPQIKHIIIRQYVKYGLKKQIKVYIVSPCKKNNKINGFLKCQQKQIFTENQDSQN